LNNEFISTGELPRQKKVEKATLRNGQLARLHGHRVARESKEITHCPRWRKLHHPVNAAMSYFVSSPASANAVESVKDLS
jgi:hypothetical protein